MSRATYTQRDWLIAAAFALAILTFQLALWAPKVDWGGDFAQYIIHARNLAEGRSYTDTGYLYEPTTYHAPRHYPPGFPLMMAPIWASKGLDFFWLRVPGMIS